MSRKNNKAVKIMINTQILLRQTHKFYYEKQ